MFQIRSVKAKVTTDEATVSHAYRTYRLAKGEVIKQIILINATRPCPMACELTYTEDTDARNWAGGIALMEFEHRPAARAYILACNIPFKMGMQIMACYDNVSVNNDIRLDLLVEVEE